MFSIIRKFVVILAVMNSSVAIAGSVESVFQDAALYTVKIRTITKHPYYDDTHGTTIGAGFLVNKEKGWILTNRHVVAEAPSAVDIRFKNTDYFPAKKLYLDPQVDLALISIPTDSIPEDAIEAELGCYESPEMGNAVVVFGHPAGLNFTGTRGIVSGTTFIDRNELLQTDAPINGGNSGGPLISIASGKVIGISQSKIDDDNTEGLNLTVSIDHACKIIALIESNRDPSPPSFPIVFLEHDQDDPRLVVARSYYENGSTLGFGDIIKRVRGSNKRITNIDQLMFQLRGTGASADVVIERNGEETVLELPFTPQPKILDQSGLAVSGMTLGTFIPIDGAENGMEQSVYVAHVAEGSNADNAWFAAWDLIYAINGERVFSVEDVFQSLESFNDSNENVMVQVRVYSKHHDRVFDYHQLELAVSDLQLLQH